MTYRPFPEPESLAPRRAGFVQPTAALGLAEARVVLRRRLEQLLGGAQLTEIAVAQLGHQLRVQRYSPGEEIIRLGMCGDFMAVVTRGYVAVLAAAPEKPVAGVAREEPIALLLPGSTFGEAMLVDGRPSGSTLRAETDTEIYVLRRADYLAVAADPRSRPPRQIRSLWLALATVVLLLVAAGAALWLGWGMVKEALEVKSTSREPRTVMIRDEQVQVLEPADGAIVQRAAKVTVRAALTQAGLDQADLTIDGQGLGVQVNLALETVPWVVEWSWQGTEEGPHLLQVLARRPNNEWVASTPVTVTVVPEGVLAFTSNRDGVHAVYTMSSDGSNLRRWTAGPGEGRQPAWGSDGSLFYVAGAETSQAIVRRLAGIGDKGSDLLIGRDPAWAPEGARLAVATTKESVSQVFVASLAGGEPTPVTQEEVYAGQPSWSPSGNRLAYVAERDGNWDVWLLSLEDGQLQRLTDDPAMDWAPAWSPDGTHLAFVSDRGGTHQIYSVRPDGADLQRLTDLAEGTESPVWSPDGFWLAYVGYGGEGDGVNAREIYLMRADGRDQVRLTRNAFDDSQPAWRAGP